MPTDETGKIIKRGERAKGVAAMLSKMAPQLRAALPRHLDAARFIRIALTTVRRNPKILECSEQSFLGALMVAAQTGLEPDGVQAALVPYFSRKTSTFECQFQTMYRGMIALARRSGEVAAIYAHAVYEGDAFDYQLGDTPRCKHKPKGCTDPARLTHAYAVFTTKDGAKDFEVLTREQVEAVRRRAKSPEEGPWVTDYAEQARKTAIKKLLKRAPMSAEDHRALEADEEPNGLIPDGDDGLDLLATEAPQALPGPGPAQPTKDVAIDAAPSMAPDAQEDLQRGEAAR